MLFFTLKKVGIPLPAVICMAGGSKYGAFVMCTQGKSSTGSVPLWQTSGIARNFPEGGNRGQFPPFPPSGYAIVADPVRQ